MAHMTTTPTQGYWPRYRARWIFTALVCGAIAVVTSSGMSPAGLAVRGLGNAVILGSLVNLVVAAFPRRS